MRYVQPMLNLFLNTLHATIHLVFSDLLSFGGAEILPSRATKTELASRFSQVFAYKIMRITGNLDWLPLAVGF